LLERDRVSSGIQEPYPGVVEAISLTYDVPVKILFILRSNSAPILHYRTRMVSRKGAN